MQGRLNVRKDSGNWDYLVLGQDDKAGELMLGRVLSSF